jgi:homoserine dehydrogenase
MSKHKKIIIGLFGFGVVGEGLYRVLAQTPSLQGSIKKICIKHPEKLRVAPPGLFTTNKNELLFDEEINVIVEVTNDAVAAFDIVKTGLKNGKSVVSAGKKMIAEHLAEIMELQRETGLSILYESAACASIPIIRNLEEYYDNDLLHAMQAIVNGSTNFILSRIFNDHLDFDAALKLAQHLGFAESDPTLDVEGFDAVNKWIILLNHAYGIVAAQEEMLFNGIQNIQLSDAQFAREKGWAIKLVAQATKRENGQIAAFVLPQFVKPDNQLAYVNDENNGVVIESGFADKQFFFGKGAGSLPTGSAILSDISALRYNYKYEYKKRYHHQPAELSTDYCLNVFLSFEDWEQVPQSDFISIHTYYHGPERGYLTGIIRASTLRGNSWWRQNGFSLILMPDPIQTGGREANVATAGERELKGQLS